MAKVDALLGVLGLTTRQHLDKAIAKKKQWHGLVRDVFAQYYLKFRESSLDNLPELPARYSADWEEFMKKEVDAFLKLDLESVGELLETCGFGIEKWDQIKEAGFPAFRKLVEDYLDESDQVGDNGHAAMTDIAEAASEDVRLLLADHPDVIDEIVSRFNPETGLFRTSASTMTRRTGMRSSRTSATATMMKKISTTRRSAAWTRPRPLSSIVKRWSRS